MNLDPMEIDASTSCERFDDDDNLSQLEATFESEYAATMEVIGEGFRRLGDLCSVVADGRLILPLPTHQLQFIRACANMKLLSPLVDKAWITCAAQTSCTGWNPYVSLCIGPSTAGNYGIKEHNFKVFSLAQTKDSVVEDVSALDEIVRAATDLTGVSVLPQVIPIRPPSTMISPQTEPPSPLNASSAGEGVGPVAIFTDAVVVHAPWLPSGFCSDW